MYKHSAKSSQRRARIRGNSERRSGDVKGHTKTKPVPNVGCPICAQAIPRMSRAIQVHLLEVHSLRVTEPEAYRLASPRKKKRAPYTEGLKPTYAEVSGGLPSLGRRR